ncbi:MFS transporter [Nocardia suismassiliense]|uniref:MFS transporter n=1 Tax=Nocardia suismassiliense TaxID=2077092 RepID=UPI00131EF2AD|nr:MFS transporter [Nocardia suismassiliense]
MTSTAAIAAGSAPSVAPRALGRSRWVILGIGVGAQASFTSLAQGLPSVGPLLQQHWQLTLLQTGAVLTAVSLGASAAMFGWGVVADRVGERLVLAIGLTGAAAATSAAAFAPSYLPMMGWLIVAGSCGGCVSAATGRAVMRAFAVGQRGLALGIRQTAPTLGAAAGAAALPPLAMIYGIKTALLVLAAGMLTGAVLGAAGLPGKSTERTSSTSGLLVLANRHLWWLCAAAACGVTAQTTLVVYLVQYLVQVRHVDLRQAAIALTVCQLLGAGARIAAGRWTDHLGSRTLAIRTLTLFTVVGLVALATFLRGPAIIVYPLGLITVVTAASTYGLYITAGCEIAGIVHAGSATGLLNSVMYGSGAIAPIGIGAVISATNWQFGLVALAALTGFGWLVALPLSAREARGWPPPSPRPRGSGHDATKGCVATGLAKAPM